MARIIILTIPTEPDDATAAVRPSDVILDATTLTGLTAAKAYVNALSIPSEED